jgi:ribosomal protein L11 methyltransferase
VIKPSWEDYQALPTDVVIELDPGMAFGTGTHHTTVMCIKSLEREIKPGNVVFDVGTGSGVLAIFAAKLGAAQVQAIDLDPLAVRVANENVALNHVNDVITVQQGDLLTGVTGQADVIVANIVADVIMRILKDVPNRLTASGLFIASGIINERLGEVTAAFLQSELIIDQVIEEGGWAAIVAHKGGQ